MTDDPRIDPADLRSVRFPGSFRRYEARAVDEFLESVAQRIEATNALVDDLRRRLDDPDAPPSGGSSAFTLLPREEPVFDVASEPDPAPAGEAAPVEKPNLGTLSDDELVTLVGEETAHVLSTARHAADDIRTKAEESASRVIREATAEAKRLVDEAEQRSTALTAEAQTVRDTAVAAAEEEGRRIKADAAASVEQIRATAEAEAKAATEAAERIRSDAEEEAAAALEEARSEGRNMVGEAKEVRARILADLQRRRDAGRSQVERLAAGRQRLLDAYAAVRANVDDITEQLDTALVEDSDSETDVLEEEIAAAASHVAAADADRAAADQAAADRAAVEAVEPEAAEPEAVDTDTDTGTEDDAGVDQPVVEAAEEPSPDDTPTEPEPVAETATAPVEVVAEPADADAGAPEVDVPEAEILHAGGPESGAAEDDVPTAGDTDAGDTGDVDALFARIRSERAESVARAQEVLADGDRDRDEPPTEAGAGEADDVATPVEAEVPDEAAVTEEAEPSADVEPTPSADPDQVPIDMLAVGPVHELRGDVIAKLEKSMSRALKRHLADEQNEVLDALRQQESTEPADLLPAREAQIDGYADVAIDGLAAASQAGVSTVDGARGEADAGALAVALAEALVDPFRRRIEDSAADVDGDADALDERLRALYREWKVERIGPVVSDSLLAAFAAGQFAAAPDGAALRWLIDPEQGPCPDAQDNALAGVVAKGEPFPTGDACPQAHPGCRCLLAVDG